MKLQAARPPGPFLLGQTNFTRMNPNKYRKQLGHLKMPINSRYVLKIVSICAEYFSDFTCDCFSSNYNKTVNEGLIYGCCGEFSQCFIKLR